MGRDILFGLAAFNVSYGYIKHRAAVDHQAAGVKPEHQQIKIENATQTTTEATVESIAPPKV